MSQAAAPVVAGRVGHPVCPTGNSILHQAERLVSALRSSGCVLDTKTGLSSDYARRALDGSLSPELSAETAIIVNFRNGLNNPAGAMIWQCPGPAEPDTHILAALATPAIEEQNSRPLRDSFRLFIPKSTRHGDNVGASIIRIRIGFWGFLIITRV